MKAFVLASLLGFVLAPTAARAHESGLHVKGTVKHVAPDHLVLTALDGKDHRFAVTPDTKYLRGGAQAKPEDVKAGERAVVHARRDGDALTATEVRLAPKGGKQAPKG